MQKSALVTGGNSGIGYATAKRLKDNGYAVTICGRDKARVEKAATELAVSYIVADLGDREQLPFVAKQFQDKPLNALVNNAAIARFKPISMCNDEDFDDFFNINVRAPLELIKSLLPSLKLTRGGVCNVSSAVVNNGLPNAALYAATKGALEASTKSLALELSPFGVRVNAVSPGAIDTPIITKLGVDEATQAAIKTQQEATIPMRRFGEAAEVAEVITAQLESSYTTGAIWSVDGGVNAY